MRNCCIGFAIFCLLGGIFNLGLCSCIVFHSRDFFTHKRVVADDAHLVTLAVSVAYFALGAFILCKAYAPKTSIRHRTVNRNYLKPQRKVTPDFEEDSLLKELSEEE